MYAIRSYYVHRGLEDVDVEGGRHRERGAELGGDGPEERVVDVEERRGGGAGEGEGGGEVGSGVITSYSIHYTKLYDFGTTF